jgi:hypothetical protein
MHRKIAFTALSLAIMLGGVSGALAAGKKHSGHEAYASTGVVVADPSHNTGANHEGWCDLDAKCNGWTEWLQDVSAGKLSAGK